jgi:hypothetical protein
MAESGALRQLFASFVFSFDQGTLARVNGAVDAAKTHVANLSQGFTTTAATAAQKLGSAVGRMSGWTAAVAKATAEHEKAAAAGGKMEHAFAPIAGMVGKWVGAFAAVKLMAFAEAQIEVGEQTYRLAKRVGVGFEDLQKISKFVAPAGITIDKLQRPLLTLTKNLTAAATTGKGPASAAFKELGINIDKGSKPKAIDVFYQLAGALGELEDDTRRTALTSKLLGMQGTALLPAFENSKEAVAKLREEIDASGVAMSESFGRNAERIGMANRKMAGAFKTLKISAVSIFLPAWTLLAETMFKVQKAMIGVIKQTQLLQLTVGVFAAQFLKGKLLAVLASTIVKFGGWRAAMISLDATAGPFLLKMAGLALIALIVDDLIGTFRGLDSVTRDVFESLVGVDKAKQVVEDLKAVWDRFGGTISTVGKGVLSFFGEAFLGTLSLIGLAFSRNSDESDRWVAALLRNSESIGKAFDWVGKQISGVFDWVGAKWNALIDSISEALAKLPKIFTGGPKVGISGMGGGMPGDQSPPPSFTNAAPPPKPPEFPSFPNSAPVTSGPGKVVTINDQRKLTVTTTGGAEEVNNIRTKLDQSFTSDREATAKAVGL